MVENILGQLLVYLSISLQMEIRNVQQNSIHVFKVGDGKLRNNHSDLWAVGT